MQTQQVGNQPHAFNWPGSGGGGVTISFTPEILGPRIVGDRAGRMGVDAAAPTSTPSPGAATRGGADRRRRPRRRLQRSGRHGLQPVLPRRALRLQLPVGTLSHGLRPLRQGAAEARLHVGQHAVRRCCRRSRPGCSRRRGVAQRARAQTWQDHYLVAPIWRFWIGEHILGTTVAGALMPSVDQVGRYFPLSIMYFAEDVDSLPPPLLSPLDHWYASIEQRLLARAVAGDRRVPPDHPPRPRAAVRAAGRAVRAPSSAPELPATEVAADEPRTRCRSMNPRRRRPTRVPTPAEPLEASAARRRRTARHARPSTTCRRRCPCGARDGRRRRSAAVPVQGRTDASRSRPACRSARRSRPLRDADYRHASGGPLVLLVRGVAERTGAHPRPARGCPTPTSSRG